MRAFRAPFPWVGTFCVAIGLALCTLGCRDDGERAAQRRVVTAPPQSHRVLALGRVRFESPPKFDLIEVGERGAVRARLFSAPQSSGARLRRAATPAWAPDRRRLYFTGTLAEREGRRFTYEETDVFSVDAKGGTLSRLTDTHDAGKPVPSPDGRTIAFARREHQGELPITAALWLLDADGGDARRLLDSDDGRIDIPGSWSPDGSTLAFTRCRFEPPASNGMQPNTCGVYTVSADGSDVHKLASRAASPSYSPDGHRITFVSDRDENGTLDTGEDEAAFANELYTMDAEGGDSQRLTTTKGLDERAPAWSPDGAVIAYEREGPARFTSQVMLVDADGRCARRLIGDAAGNGRDSFEDPAWRPGRPQLRPPARICTP